MPSPNTMATSWGRRRVRRIYAPRRPSGWSRRLGGRAVVERGRLLLGSVEVDGHWPMTNSDSDAFVRITAGVPFTMDDPLGNEAEVPGRDLDALPSARAEVDEEPAADAVGIRVMAGMDMPARGLVRGVLDTTDPDVLVGERFEPGDTWCRRAGSRISSLVTRIGRSITHPPFARPDAQTTVR